MTNAVSTTTTTTSEPASRHALSAVPAIIGRLLASNIVAYVVTLAVTVCATTSSESAVALSNGNYTWLLALMSPFFIVFFDFRRLMYLGASKRDYLIAAIGAYALLGLAISACNTLIHLVIDPLNHRQQVINLMDVCGWTKNGWFVAFLQQTMFLVMVMLFLHMLLSMQTRWYGWLTDAVLVAIIAVFTPIAPLRAVLGGFFGLVMLNANPFTHIGVCLLLSAAFGAIGLLILKRTTL